MARRMECPRWCPGEEGYVDGNAVEIGRNGRTGETMYVGRAFDVSTGNAIPGKIVPSHQACYYGFHGEEKRAGKYEYLTASKRCQLEWIPASGGAVPAGAIEGGYNTKTAEPIFIARAIPNVEPNGIHGGRLSPSEGCAVVSYGGHELAAITYEVLCAKYIYA